MFYGSKSKVKININVVLRLKIVRTDNKVNLTGLMTSNLEVKFRKVCYIGSYPDAPVVVSVLSTISETRASNDLTSGE